MQNRRRAAIGGRAVAIAAAAGALIPAATTRGHDEDWRKLADKLPPVYGPIYRAPAGLSLAATDAGGVPAQAASSGVTLLSQIPVNQFGLNSQDAQDCWGYTSASGREYAIITLSNGYGFVEITDPADPQIIGTVSAPSSLWHDVKVLETTAGVFAYGVSEGGAGVQVMDITQIDSGVVTLVRNAQSGGHSTTHNIVANPDAGTLWLAGANIGNGGLVHLDLSDPTFPTPDGGWTQMYVHDAQVISYTQGPLAGREIAYCASGFNGGFTQTGLRVVDVTDPQNVQVLATLFYPAAGYSHQVWATDDLRYLYLNDELDEGSTVSVTTTRIINIEDPENPFFVGTFTSGLPAIDHNLYVNGRFIYEANYRSGLRVFDAADPTAPVEIASFDTFPASDGVGFNGAWSSYPFFPSGTVIVSDIESGLFVLRVDAIDDLNVPRIVLETPPPAEVAPGGGDGLSVSVLSPSDEPVGATVTLVVEDALGEVTEVTLAQAGPGLFEGGLPEVACGGPVRFFFRAVADSGETIFLPKGAPADRFEAIAADGFSTSIADSFQSDLGWGVSGDASDGQWSRGVPAGGGDRGDPPADFDGSGACYLTDNADGNSDVDDGSTTLTSPIFDLTGGGVVEYAYWFADVPGGPADGIDALVLELSFDGGETWQERARYTDAAIQWRTDQIVVSEAEGTSTARARFTVSDIATPNVIEGGLDAFRVRRFECSQVSACNGADITADGTLTFADVTAFIEAFGSGTDAADVTGDGLVSFADVTAFIEAFNAGCP